MGLMTPKVSSVCGSKLSDPVMHSQVLVNTLHRLFFLACSVMVLDAGRMVEFDSPEELLADKNGLFYSMAKDAGLTSSYR